MKTRRKALCIIIAIATLCLTACGAQKQPENLARTVEVPYGEGTAIFEFNEKGLLVAEKNVPWSGYDLYYTYDEENKITEIFCDNTDENKSIEDKTVIFEYYSDGKLKRDSTYEMPDKKPIEHKEYIYDNDRIDRINSYDYIYTKECQEIFYRWSYEYYYTETDNNMVVNTKMVHFEGTTDESFDTYDKDGKLILEEYSAGDMEYVYDEDGILIKELENFGEIVYEYQYENDHPVKKVCVKDEYGDSVNKKGRYEEYKYFDNGNIKVIYRYNKDGYLEDSEAAITIEASDEIKGNYSDIDYYLFF